VHYNRVMATCDQNVTQRSSSLRSIPVVKGEEGPQVSLTAAPEEVPVAAGGVREKNTAACEVCSKRFQMMSRRHHCRICGKCVCESCSPSMVQLEGHKKVQRVCTPCVANGIKATVATDRLVLLAQRLEHAADADARFDSTPRTATPAAPAVTKMTEAAEMAEASGRWDTEHAHKIGSSLGQYEGKEMLLDVASHNSVSKAALDLDAGRVSCESGVCIVYSESQGSYYLLFRSDLRKAVLERYCISEVEGDEEATDARAAEDVPADQACGRALEDAVERCEEAAALLEALRAKVVQAEARVAEAEKGSQVLADCQKAGAVEAPGAQAAAPVPEERCEAPPTVTWEPNTPACSLCETTFTCLKRPHHCRRCGLCVCASCSPGTLEIGGHEQRACKHCVASRQGSDAQ